MRAVQKAVACAAVAVTCGCGAASERPVKIINGQSTTNAVYPGVVDFTATFKREKADCTGTFISSTTLLTAAHCVQPVTSATGIVVRGLGATSVAMLANPRWDPRGEDPQQMAYDMALVRFAAGTAPGTLAFASRPPRVGDADTIVGYGDSDDKSGVGWGTLRAGTNVITALIPGAIETQGPISSGGSDRRSVSAPGDSGGPMLVGDGIVGTCSGSIDYFGDHKFTDGYANVFNSAARAFFRQAAAAGYDVPDMSGWPAPSAADGTLTSARTSP